MLELLLNLLDKSLSISYSLEVVRDKFELDDNDLDQLVDDYWFYCYTSH